MNFVRYRKEYVESPLNFFFKQKSLASNHLVSNNNKLVNKEIKCFQKRFYYLTNSLNDVYYQLI